MYIAKQNKGFTLIELLVVISIIGILASIITASLDQARVKARDAHRLDQMKQLSNALELYYTTHGFYPDQNSASAHITYVRDIVGLTPTHIQSLPVDPTRTGPSSYRYTAAVNGAGVGGYSLLVDLENDNVTWCRYETGQPGPWDSIEVCK